MSPQWNIPKKMDNVRRFERGNYGVAFGPEGAGMGRGLNSREANLAVEEDCVGPMVAVEED